MKQNNFLFWHLALYSMGSFSHIAGYRRLFQKYRKMNLQPILNKNSPHAHMESKFNMLGVAESLLNIWFI
jgi:hypothetical protein